MTITKTVISITAVAIALGACSATQHSAEVQAANDIDGVTVGIVQREIHLGMSAANVARVLGSPNIVTTDEERRETWIYDKISTDVTYSRSNGTIVGLIFGGSGGGLGIGSRDAGATSTSQRTLTVIVRFDDQNWVRDFSYHTSRF